MVRLGGSAGAGGDSELVGAVGDGNGVVVEMDP